MVAHPPFGSPSFRLVTRGLVALHRLIKDGKDDSLEAEAVRDALDVPLNALNRTEKERAQWLSEDLYSVSEPAVAIAQKEMNLPAQQQLNESFEARQSREWDRALTLLRRCGESISPALLSYLRGWIWLEAGNADIATVFYRHASESDPANANYRAMYISALAESDLDAARELAGVILADDENHAPLMVARAADICFDKTRAASDGGSTRFVRELIPILERNMVRLDHDDDAAIQESAYVLTATLLGSCHEFLGNTGAAVDSYSRALQVDPNKNGLLVARGILQYGTSPRAITDFEQAIGLGSPVIWPYLFLAHHYLITNRFDPCRVMCEMGLRMHGSDSAKSQLEDWRAIAQAELGFSPELVRAAFEAAVRLDPSNDLARRNQTAFESFLKARPTHPRLKWEQKSEAVVRHFGLAERRLSLPLAA